MEEDSKKSQCPESFIVRTIDKYNDYHGTCCCQAKWKSLSLSLAVDVADRLKSTVTELGDRDSTLPENPVCGKRNFCY